MRIVISVSDPWEFGESINWKLLEGDLLNVADDDQGGKALIRLDTPVTYRGSVWRHLVAKVRHEGDTMSDLKSKKKIQSALVGITDEQADSKDALDISRWRGGLAFVANIEPIPWPRMAPSGSCLEV